MTVLMKIKPELVSYDDTEKEQKTLEVGIGSIVMLCRLTLSHSSIARAVLKEFPTPQHPPRKTGATPPFNAT